MYRARWFRVAAIAGVLAAACDGADEPDYEALIALRSSAAFRDALSAAEARLATDPADSDAAGVRALIYANAVDFLAMRPAEALEAKHEALTRALDLDETNPWTLAAFALVNMTTDLAAAERALNRCIEEHPTFLECYNLYGDLLRKSGRQERAGEVYRSAMRRWPEDGELRISYALHLQETEKPVEAVATLEALTREQPDFARGHWHLAVLRYESGGDLGGAGLEARRALDLDPLIWNGAEFVRALEADIAK